MMRKRLAVVPFSISLFASPLGGVIFLLLLFGGRRPVIVALVLLIIWLVIVGLYQTRGWWLSRHLYASPRWLRAVCAAVGTMVFDEALAHLTILRGDDRSYRIERTHLANAVQVAWNARRNERLHDNGVRLRDVGGQA